MDKETQKAISETQESILHLLQIIEDLKKELARQGLIEHEVGQSILGKPLMEQVSHHAGKIVESKTPEELFAE